MMAQPTRLSATCALLSVYNVKGAVMTLAASTIFELIHEV
jgi:hypothetical protein